MTAIAATAVLATRACETMAKNLGLFWLGARSLVETVDRLLGLG